MKPYIVAIAGGTCSGKSTLTNRLEEMFKDQLDTKVFHMDEYFKKDPPTTIAPISRKEYVEHNHPTTMDLDKFYEDFRHEQSENHRLILVEGILALYLDEVREAADLKIFVDLSSDARLVRRIKNHMAWGQSYEQVTDRFIDTVRFRHNEFVEPSRWHADLLVNGTLDDNKGVDVAYRYILSQLS